MTSVWKFLRKLTIAKANYDKRCAFLAKLTAKIIKRAFKNLKPKVIIDVGGGKGLIANYISKTVNVNDVIVVDISKESLQDTPNNLHSLCCDAHYLPFKEKQIDCILMFSIIELLKYPRKCLKEAMRCLKEDGLLIIQMPNFNGFIEHYTGLPFPFLWPNKIKTLIFQRLFNILNINWDLNPETIKLLTGYNWEVYYYNYGHEIIPAFFKVFLVLTKAFRKHFPSGFIFILRMPAQTSSTRPLQSSSRR